MSKNELKFIKSLHKKSERDQNKLFIAEGSKLVNDLIKSGAVATQLLVTKKWINDHSSGAFTKKIIPLEISDSEMDRITALSSPSEVFAIFKQPTLLPFNSNIPANILLLDDIRDPGNMGTIIRTADWFGIKHIICSPNSVDCFNPKVIQSTMGSILRVNIYYQSLVEFIQNHQSFFTFYGTFMDGISIKDVSFDEKCAFVIGNEAHGISSLVEKKVDKRITIPSNQLNDGIIGPESLNAAIATSVILYDWHSKK